MEEDDRTNERWLVAGQEYFVQNRMFSINTQNDLRAPRFNTGFPDPKAWVIVEVTDSGIRMRGGLNALYEDTTDPNHSVWKRFPQTNEKLQQPFVEMGHHARVWIKQHMKSEGNPISINTDFTEGQTPQHPPKYNGTSVKEFPAKIQYRGMNVVN